MNCTSWRTQRSMLVDTGCIHSLCVRGMTAICFFFFNDTATTEIYTLSYTTLFRSAGGAQLRGRHEAAHVAELDDQAAFIDRKSTRLNSSHPSISYAVFCLKKKIQTSPTHHPPSSRLHRHPVRPVPPSLPSAYGVAC